MEGEKQAIGDIGPTFHNGNGIVTRARHAQEMAEMVRIVAAEIVEDSQKVREDAKRIRQIIAERKVKGAKIEKD